MRGGDTVNGSSIAESAIIHGNEIDPTDQHRINHASDTGGIPRHSKPRECDCRSAASGPVC
jgi:hypothetical protein